MKILYSLTCHITRIFVRLFYGHKIYGQEHICSKRAIIAPSHTSFLDPPLIAASWPTEVFFLAKKKLFSNPIFGPLIRRLNAYPVTGTAEDVASIKLICQLLKNDHQVVIFPSGIRSFDNTIGEIKPGVAMLALRCQAPIIPVYIDGCFDIWNRTRTFPKLKGKTACVIGSPIECQPFLLMEKKSGQLAMSEKVGEALEALKAWYDNGAIGSPP